MDSLAGTYLPMAVVDVKGPEHFSADPRYRAPATETPFC